MMEKRKSRWLMLLMALGTLACGILPGGEVDQQATIDAISASVVQTATAQAAVAVSPEEVVAEVEAAATQAVVEAAATQEVVEAEIAVQADATAEALVPIQNELSSYGLDPNAGMLGWIHPPVTIFTEGYLQFDYANDYISTVASDFVLAADITWNTRFGTTGCGFVLRSDGNEEAFNQYMVIATRGASGHVGFITMRDGEAIEDESVDIYANGIDPQFDWQNDSTNRLVVVGRGDVFQIYTNGTLIDEVTATAGYEKGFIAFVALNESGDTTCTYDNAWLWLLN